MWALDAGVEFSARNAGQLQEVWPPSDHRLSHRRPHMRLPLMARRYAPPRRRDTYDPPAPRRHLGIRAPLAASPRPEGLPARRFHCRLTLVPLPRPIMCLHDPRSWPLGDALRSLENFPGLLQFPDPHKSQHHIMRFIVTVPPYMNQVDRGPPTTCPAPLQFGPLGRPRGLALRLRARGGLRACPATLVVLPLPGTRLARRPSSSRLAPAARCHMVARRTLAPSLPDVGG